MKFENLTLVRTESRRRSIYDRRKFVAWALYSYYIGTVEFREAVEAPVGTHLTKLKELVEEKIKANLKKLIQ